MAVQHLEARHTSLDELRRLSVRTRRLILETVHHAGAGHVGGPLSVTDILVNLYFNRLRIDPDRPDDPGRDRCILSKGHSSIAIYTVLALRGYFPVEELSTFDQIDSRLQGHPDLTALPGLDMSTGSLGQGLSPGIGMALGARLQRSRFPYLGNSRRRRNPGRANLGSSLRRQPVQIGEPHRDSRLQPPPTVRLA